MFFKLNFIIFICYSLVSLAEEYNINLFLNFSYFNLEKDLYKSYSTNFFINPDIPNPEPDIPEIPNIPEPDIPNIPSVPDSSENKIFFLNETLSGNSRFSLKDLDLIESSNFLAGMGSLATNYEITNVNNIILNATKPSSLVGMLGLNGGSVFNNSEIEVNSAIGLASFSNSLSQNNKDGTIKINGGFGLVSSNSSKAINHGEIFLTGTSSTGLLAIGSNSQTINNGIIQSDDNGEFLIGMQSEEGGVLINSDSGKIILDKYDIGFLLKNGGTFLNSGTIEIDSFGYGIYAKGDIIGENKGVITLNNIQSIGVVISNGTKDTTFTNSGTIEGSGRTGIYLNNFNGEAQNTGVISIKTGTSAVEVIGSGTFINNNIINSSGSTAGIYVSGKYKENSLDVPGGTIINNGFINITPTDSFSIIPNGALYVNRSGTAINNGTINISAPDYTGMGGFGDQVVLKNEENGVINLLSAGSIAFTLTQNASAHNYGTINLNNGSLGTGFNYSGGTIYNFGTINAPNDNELGNSLIKLVMEKGGSIITENSSQPLNSDIFIGNSLLSLYEDKANVLKKINLNIDSPIKGNIYLNNSLYAIDSKDSNSVTVYRQDFNDILSGDSLGDFLEKQYYESNNIIKDAIYLSFQSANSSDDLKKLVYEIFGVNIKSTLLFQTLNTLKFSSDTLVDSIISSSKNDKEINYIFGYDYNYIKQNHFDFLTEYSQNINTFNLGILKRLNSKLKIGSAFSYNNLDVKYKDSSYRKDDFYNGSIFIVYNKDNLNALLLLSGGYGIGNINRNLKFNYLSLVNDVYSNKIIQENLKSKIENKYFSIEGNISKRYYNKLFYLHPEINLKSFLISQNFHKETDGNYSQELKPLDSNHTFGSVALNIGKKIPLWKTYTTDISLGLILEKEFNHNNNTEVMLTNIREDTFNLKFYEEKEFSKKLSFNWNFQKNSDLFEIYLNYQYNFDLPNDFKFSTGIKFTF